MKLSTTNYVLVDSHCHLDHLDLTKYHGQLSLALDAAQAAGVGYILCVCIELNHFPQVLKIAEQHDWIYASVGLHPNEAATAEPSTENLIALAASPKIIAIGETGLDYYRSEGDLTWQQDRFRNHIRAAKATNKPLIVHSRDARIDTIRILKEEQADIVGGVLHCFTEDWEMAQQAMALNFYISFSGIITFRNAEQIRNVARKMPLDRMLIETDAPYLAPVPHRGKPNEPAYVRYVAQQIAELRGITEAEVAEQTTNNFLKLFLREGYK